MNFSAYIAKRYFWSKEKKNFINILSIISMFVVAVATMALVVVLSVFNGLEGLIRSLYGSFDPEIKIVSTYGKSFHISDNFLDSLRSIEGVGEVVEVIEDNAYVRYNNSELIAVIKGVSDNYIKVNNIESKIREGKLMLSDGKRGYAVIGQGVGNDLGVSTKNDFFSLQVFYPKNLRSRSLDPNNALSQKNIMVSGIFAIEKQFDDKYILVPLSFAQELLRYGNKRSSLEITSIPGSDIETLQNNLKNHLGEGFKVLNSDEQHDTIIRTIKIEKLFVFLILASIIGVSSINIFFALTMLAIDKKKDISMLVAMGATSATIRKIFLYEGGIISLSGAGVGLLLGLLFCTAQQEFGLISMGMQTSVVDFYPIRMEWQDFMLTSITIIIITFLASIKPAIMASKIQELDKL